MMTQMVTPPSTAMMAVPTILTKYRLEYVDSVYLIPIQMKTVVDG
jgi:hypothetical protein